MNLVSIILDTFLPHVSFFFMIGLMSSILALVLHTNTSSVFPTVMNMNLRGFSHSDLLVLEMRQGEVCLKNIRVQNCQEYKLY